MSGAGTDKDKSEKSAKFWKKESGPFPGSVKLLAAEEPSTPEQAVTTSHALSNAGQSAVCSMPATPKKQGKVQDAFFEYERSTQDAWDAGEDGGSGGRSSSACVPLHQHAAAPAAAAAAMRIDPAVVRTTAEQVLQNHTRQRQASGAGTNAATVAAAAAAAGSGPVSSATAAAANQRPRAQAGAGGRLAEQQLPASSLSLSRQAQASAAAAAASSAPVRGSQTSSAAGPATARVPNGGSSQVKPAEADQRDQGRAARFEQVVYGPATDLSELRQLSWSGIPRKLRPIVWKILSGYLPAVSDRRQPTLERKRAEYFGFIEQYFNTKYRDQHQDTYRQIQIDVPRMNPLIALFQNRTVQQIFERILFIWAIRRPASGYVQGINDLVTPFFVVFLSEYTDTNVESPDADVSSLSAEQLSMIEADSFWCLSKLLDSIQDNYTFAQLGIQKKINQLKDLVKRIDYPLYRHLEANGIEFLQFSFRWMNNLLMREMPLRCAVRLWDTYQSEPDGFASFHLYVCAAFLTLFSTQLLKGADFQHVMTMLQNLPTSRWGDNELCELLAKAYQLKCMFADAPQHLKQHAAAAAGT